MKNTKTLLGLFIVIIFALGLGMVIRKTIIEGHGGGRGGRFYGGGRGGFYGRGGGSYLDYPYYDPNYYYPNYPYYY